MTAIFRVYLRRPDGTAEKATSTTDADTALAALAALVARTDLAGEPVAAVLSLSKRIMTEHRFDIGISDPEYWRHRVGASKLPADAGARYGTVAGKQTCVSLPEAAVSLAAEIGDGNVSRGIRRALGAAADIVRSGGQLPGDDHLTDDGVIIEVVKAAKPKTMGEMRAAGRTLISRSEAARIIGVASRTMSKWSVLQ